VNEWVEVISGLNINDTIVTKGFQGLAKAKKVKIIDESEKSKVKEKTTAKDKPKKNNGI
jgi:hypothetical protein